MIEPAVLLLIIPSSYELHDNVIYQLAYKYTDYDDEIGDNDALFEFIHKKTELYFFFFFFF